MFVEFVFEIVIVIKCAFPNTYKEENNIFAVFIFIIIIKINVDSRYSLYSSIKNVNRFFTSTTKKELL
jgi:hypothetical protein